MLIHTTKKVLKEVEETVRYYHVCDKCNKEIEERSNFDAFSFDFKIRTGTAYPDGGDGDEWKLDLCEPCAMGLVEELKENGYRVQEKEWDI